jgi:hypothetical protein
VQSTRTGSDLFDLFHDALVRYEMMSKCYETVAIITFRSFVVMALLSTISTRNNKDLIKFFVCLGVDVTVQRQVTKQVKNNNI